jgi:hypothetical protein
MINRVLATLLFGVQLGLLYGCGASGENDGNAPVVLPRQGTIRVMHVIPDAGRMTSFLSSSVYSTGQFGESSTLKQSLVGQYVMNILLTPPNDITTTLVTTSGQSDRRGRVLVHHDRADGESAAGDQQHRNRPGRRSKTSPRSFRRRLPDPARPTSTSATDVYVTDTAAIADRADRDGEFRRPHAADSPGCPRIESGLAGQDRAVRLGSFNVARLKRSIYLLIGNFGPTGNAARGERHRSAAEDFQIRRCEAACAANMMGRTVGGHLRRYAGRDKVPERRVWHDDAVRQGAQAPSQPTSRPPVCPGTIVATGPLPIVGGRSHALYATGLAPTTPGGVRCGRSSAASWTGAVPFPVCVPSAGFVDVRHAGAADFRRRRSSRTDRCWAAVRSTSHPARTICS